MTRDELSDERYDNGETLGETGVSLSPASVQSPYLRRHSLASSPLSTPISVLYILGDLSPVFNISSTSKAQQAINSDSDSQSEADQ